VWKDALKAVRAADQTFPTRRFTIHDLRHTAATLMVQAGANVKAVQRQLGHKDATTTLNTYADLFDDELDDVAVRMSGVIIRATEAGDE
jgi:integrase